MIKTERAHLIQLIQVKREQDYTNLLMICCRLLGMVQKVEEAVVRVMQKLV
ncbi:MAG: hypothetical protein RID09_17715 [Coleofasciculus sp. G1-WW12-02]|uniref:hypothetical protein n=1 Tax=Coleofasciculus sp. G1-WW12-02 TaxID=3068483 RepID=UPI0032F80414